MAAARATRMGRRSPTPAIKGAFDSTSTVQSWRVAVMQPSVVSACGWYPDRSLDRCIRGRQRSPMSPSSASRQTSALSPRVIAPGDWKSIAAGTPWPKDINLPTRVTSISDNLWHPHLNSWLHVQSLARLESPIFFRLPSPSHLSSRYPIHISRGIFAN